VTKSWFEPEPEPALPEYKNDENKSKNIFIRFSVFLTKPLFSH
jgi:hypothetical protein